MRGNDRLPLGEGVTTGLFLISIFSFLLSFYTLFYILLPTTTGQTEDGVGRLHSGDHERQTSSIRGIESGRHQLGGKTVNTWKRCS